MSLKIKSSVFSILLFSLMLSSCASNQGDSQQGAEANSAEAKFPSKDLMKTGLELQDDHSLKTIQAHFLNADIAKNKLISEAYLNIFIKEGINDKCRWLLTKWHLDDGLLSYQLECDNDINEVLFKVKLVPNGYKIYDIYSQIYGIWLSELVSAQVSDKDDLKHWQVAMDEIRDIEYGYGQIKVVVKELEKLKRKNYFSEVLRINYASKASTTDAEFEAYLEELYELTLAHREYPSFISISATAFDGDFDASLAILDKVESKIGQSKMTLLRRSWFLYQKGDISQAYYYAIFAHKFGNNSFWSGYYLIRYSIETGQFDDALALLKLQYDTTDWSDDWIIKFKNGEEFTNLKSYKQWREKG